MLSQGALLGDPNYSEETSHEASSDALPSLQAGPTRQPKGFPSTILIRGQQGLSHLSTAFLQMLELGLRVASGDRLQSLHNERELQLIAAHDLLASYHRLSCPSYGDSKLCLRIPCSNQTDDLLRRPSDLRTSTIQEAQTPKNKYAFRLPRPHTRHLTDDRPCRSAG
ncbi:hypothetical protein BDZ85DRAFT_299751 [Elsinoe ampelina]|uniref:Uncharacterized protein n=1 Tax=Elsinoe ampelina TaxID=302913 RepID=A0A6A6FXE0_9PEZI|nr:hypothetical protein BDZ85DRAFT_299751 [Elsinoe ampelina]